MPICTACPHACQLDPGKLGLCLSRRADDSSVKPEGYGRITSLALDPIEKKPIAFWRSGTTVLSVGSYGCNMRCPFCQNASIAQVGSEDVDWQTITPQWLVEQACQLSGKACIGIAFTYNEPLVNWEFIRDAGSLAHSKGLVNVLVSNGMATPQTLASIAPLIDAANIDLKCFTEEGYRKLGGNLESVMHTIETLAKLPRCHLEVTTLAHPDLWEDLDQINRMAQWIASLDPTIPYHITRYFPRHKMSGGTPTPLTTLYKMRDVASRSLSRVVLGNI